MSKMSFIKFGLVLLLCDFCFCDETTAVPELKCYVCDSAQDCILDIGTPQNCTSGNCFTRVAENGTITRGCLTDNLKCDKTNCVSCKAKEEPCNSHRICKTCDSKTNAACAQTDAKQASFNSVCNEQQNRCIKLVNNEGSVERKCGVVKDCENNSEKCDSCENSNCNVGIFPENRLQCYQCSGGDNCADVTNATSQLLACALYSTSDECYIYGTDAAHVTRGCRSDRNDNNKCSASIAEGEELLCSKCNSTGCNALPYERQQKLKCLQCDSITHHNCSYSQNATDANDCKNKLRYNQNDACYTQTASNGTVWRGCLYDRAPESGACSTSECVSCSSDGCNAAATNFTCIRCRSDIEPKCVAAANTLTGTKCRNDDLAVNNRMCFTGTWNAVIIRDCLVDADERQKIVCEDDKDPQCLACSGKDCNTVKFNGASRSKFASSLMALLFIFTINW